MGNFEVLEIDSPRWKLTIEKAGDPGIFYLPEFCKFRLQGSTHRPVMLLYEENGKSVFDVSTMRDVSRLPFYQDIGNEFSSPPIDMASPEYNGPVIVNSGNDDVELLKNYRKALDAYCADNNIVTEFIRFRPLHDTVAALSGIENLVSASSVIYVDLRSGYEAAFANYRKKYRQQVRKAEREGAELRFVQPDEKNIALLASLYLDLMKRKNAKNYYFHELDYFKALFERLGKNIVMVEAYFQDEIVSSTVYYVDGKNLWAFYSGTIEEKLKTNAQKYMYDRMINWAAEKGFNYLMLGFGINTDDENDGVFFTKKGFSSLTTSVFHLRKVHKPELLQKLLKAKADYDIRHGLITKTDYFPSYYLN
ncbi:MAG: hypothetical protein A2017_14265 [Lentisphaerae bacterium GWF2_44_16]|nr:MAG: hypothetical protein A2017_14265 [Lentisphaerae bacterium GWF2_44_16]